MSAEVYDFRACQNARDQALKLDPRMVKRAIAMCCDEQRNGRSGLMVAQALQVERLARQHYTGHDPKDAA